ncbi:hypothetical protein VSR69_24195 [Paraburkholderia phytofirmans]|uniref:Uncharacterized protein n=1 Tax=Paraburkholderia dipogonis TaxID=1211383 RepID=A0ABW9B0D5_9BURK|nr:hypothetical protein [Paraburkholderia sp. BL9I2N2]
MNDEKAAKKRRRSDAEQGARKPMPRLIDAKQMQDMCHRSHREVDELPTRRCA